MAFEGIGDWLANFSEGRWHNTGGIAAGDYIETGSEGVWTGTGAGGVGVARYMDGKRRKGYGIGIGKARK